MTAPYDLTNDDALLVKTDADGNIQWKNIFRKDGDERALGFMVSKTGDYVIVGRVDPYPWDFWCMKVSPPSPSAIADATRLDKLVPCQQKKLAFL